MSDSKVESGGTDVLRVILIAIVLILLDVSVGSAQTLSFSPAANFSVGSTPIDMVRADFNADGIQDLAVTNFNDNGISILLGTGNGSFGAATNFSVGNGARAIALGDFNGDGKQDLAVVNENSNNVSILLGTGTGSFSPATNYAVGVRPRSVAVGDFNGDGKQDLVIANLTDNNVSILLGTGTGAFGSATNFAAGMGAIYAAVGDFNGDGKQDLAVANTFSNTLSVLLGTGTGAFGSATNYAVGVLPRSVLVGDFNGDGKGDLAVVNNGSNNVSILLGTGTGTFGSATSYAVGAGPFALAIGDFNADGRPDLAVANGGSNNVSVVLGTGTGSFGPAINFPVGSTPRSVVVGDFNADGKPDFAAANEDGNNISVLLNTTNFSRSVFFGAAANFGVGTAPRALVVRDFNGDGKQDLAVANLNGNDVSLLLGTGTGSFGTATSFAVGNGPLSVAAGDFNGDGKQDLAVANFNDSNISILLGTGTGGFGVAVNFSVGTGPRSIAVGDFNADGKQDLAVANGNSNNISILLGTGTGSFSAATNFAVGNNPRSLVMADFNGDGKQDLAVANFNSNNVSVLLGTGTGSFGAAINFAVGSGPLSLAAGDFNGDGKQDLAVANLNGNDVSVLLGTGTGSFGAPTNFVSSESPTFVTTGDFNNDSKQDLAVANYQSNVVSVFLGTGTGTFGGALNFTVGSGPISIAAADFNGDAKPDLATANETSGTVSILLNSTSLVGSLSINNVNVTEGNAGTTNAVFTVTLSPASTQTVTVNFATANGTATAGSDYVATSGTLTFNPGDTTKTITVVINGDTLNETNETFLVNLSNPVNATIADGQGLGTIINDDALPSLSINDVSVIEGNAGTTNAVFTVTLTPASPAIVTVNFTTANGSATAGSDYLANSGTLTFNPGETTKTITVAINGDTLNETNETLFIKLSNPVNATISDGQGLGTIINDDTTLPSVSINDVSVAEGNSGTTNAVFTVSLSGTSGQTVTVTYSTANGSAVAGSDYLATSGSLTFNPGETTKSLTVLVIGDSVPEPNENFFVNLTSSTNATIAHGQGVGTIVNDDAATAVERLSNISTRGRVLTGDNVMIGGFIIDGSASKRVLVRSRGPSMSGAPFFVPGTLANPMVRLFSGQTVIAQNDNWQDGSSCSGFICEGTAEIVSTGLDPCAPNPGQSAPPPNCALEAAILITLPPGAYTAIVTGADGGTGVGLVEVFEADANSVSELGNISTRGFVQSGDDVMIGGLIIEGSAPAKVLIRARGPSMSGAPFFVPGTLANPFLQVFSGQDVIAQNDNWQEAPSCNGVVCGGPSQIAASGLDPCQPNPGQTTSPSGCTLEAAILVTLPPGAYTAITSGVGGGTGVGLVEVFELNQ